MIVSREVFVFFIRVFGSELICILVKIEKCLTRRTFFLLYLGLYFFSFSETTNFDEEFGTSNGKYTLGEVFSTATRLFSNR